MERSIVDDLSQAVAMLPSACGVHYVRERSPRDAAKVGFSLACPEGFPYNPVDFVSPVGLQVCVPEFDRLPKTEFGSGGR
jgi:hypothetical protein